MASGGYILILAVLILGGVIATLGDRIGTKVGKARLSLFNMRPKKTAVFVTVVTGILIAASTLGVLLLASRGFRDMLLKFDTIRSDLDQTQKDLTRAKTDISKSGDEKKFIESELSKSRVKSRQVQNTLSKIEASLKSAVSREQDTESRRQKIELQSKALEAEINSLEREQQDLTAQRDQVRAQIGARDRELADRAGELRARDQDIQSRKVIIAQRESSLKQLEVERQQLLQDSASLSQNVQTLTQERQRLTEETDRLRQETALTRFNLPAIRRGKILVAGIVDRATDPAVAVESLTKLLKQANANALNAIRPGSKNIGILNLASPEIDQALNRVIDKIRDGKQYLIQIRAAENYFLDDKSLINIEIPVIENREIIPAGYRLGNISTTPNQVSSSGFRQEFDQMVDSARFQAVSLGWYPDVNGQGIEVSEIRLLLRFFDQVKELSGPIEIEAITSTPVYPGDLVIRLELVAKQNNIVVLKSGF